MTDNTPLPEFDRDKIASFASLKAAAEFAIELEAL